MSRKRNLPQCSRRKKHALSCSSRAELQFPMSSLDCVLPEGQYAQRLSSYTPVFLAGVLEHLMAHILELAAREARSSRKVRITPEHVQRALNNNETLSSLFQASSVSRGAEEGAEEPGAEEPLPEAGR